MNVRLLKMIAGASVLAAAALSGCKPSSSKAAVDAAIKTAPVEFVGRCVNETAGNPNQSIFFFPRKSEMFLYLGTAGAVRVPVSVTEQTPDSLAFTFRWSEKDEPPSTHSAKVSVVGSKWSFDFDTLKDSVCHPAPAADFYKLLPDLGFPAGKWEEKKKRATIVIAADAQAWILVDHSDNKKVHYRVIEHTDDSVVVALYFSTPTDSDDEAWIVSRLTRSGDTFTMETGDATRIYKLVAAAPTLK